MSTMLACGQWDTCKAYILGRTEASSSKRFIGGSPSVYIYLMTPVIAYQSQRLDLATQATSPGIINLGHMPSTGLAGKHHMIHVERSFAPRACRAVSVEALAYRALPSSPPRATGHCTVSSSCRHVCVLPAVASPEVKMPSSQF